MKDANGTLFDPKKHQIRGGKPLLKKDGTFARKKGVPVEIAQSNSGMLPHDSAQNGAIMHDTANTESAESFIDGIIDKGTSTPTVPAPESQQTDENPETSFIPDDLKNTENAPETEEFFDAGTAEQEAPKMSAESISISAFSIVEITEQTCAVLLGDEMTMKPDEKRRLISAWENYLATTEGIEIPPWAALLGLNALYLGTRLMLPGVQTRLINIWRNLNGQPPIQPAAEQSVVS